MSTAAALEDTTWKGDALQLLAKVAESGADFDAYTLQEEHGLRQPPHPNMWGALFRSAYSAQIITPIGFHQSLRPGRSGGVCRIWRGLPNGTYRNAAR
ncbi:hypothetical protein [Arthrobacter sp. G119Y2]|uniref:hypothetical protein n=1 Tax=Arthrobacter sp. G119Y2 TaxID=3134965 RepID=UPI003119BAF5